MQWLADSQQQQAHTDLPSVTDFQGYVCPFTHFHFRFWIFKWQYFLFAEINFSSISSLGILSFGKPKVGGNGLSLKPRYMFYHIMCYHTTQYHIIPSYHQVASNRKPSTQAMMGVLQKTASGIWSFVLRTDEQIIMTAPLRRDPNYQSIPPLPGSWCYHCSAPVPLWLPHCHAPTCRFVAICVILGAHL